MEAVVEFKERIVKFARERYDMGQNKFEDYCGISGGTIAAIKANGPTASLLMRVAEKCPELNMNWLFTGKGNMLNSVETLTSSGGGVPGKPLPLVKREALSGKIVKNFKESMIEGYYVIPEFQDEESFLTHVKGDAMIPKYNGGDIIVCKKVDNSFILWGRVYVITTKTYGSMVKRVFQGEREGFLKLVSENTKYAPFYVPVEEITSMAIVAGAVTLE